MKVCYNREGFKVKQKESHKTSYVFQFVKIKKRKTCLHKKWTPIILKHR